MSGSGTPALVVVRRAGVAHVMHEYERPAPTGGRDRHSGWGAETVEMLGAAADRVFKTLVVRVDESRLAVGVVPVAGELDLKALAQALGGRRAALVEPVEAERVTGYVVGGISPLGQRKRLPTVVDASALEQTTILISGERRGLQIELAGSDLVAMTGAVVARIGRPG